MKLNDNNLVSMAKSFPSHQRLLPRRCSFRRLAARSLLVIFLPHFCGPHGCRLQQPHTDMPIVAKTAGLLGGPETER